MTIDECDMRKWLDMQSKKERELRELKEEVLDILEKHPYFCYDSHLGIVEDVISDYACGSFLEADADELVDEVIERIEDTKPGLFEVFSEILKPVESLS